jgi:nitroreductase
MATLLPQDLLARLEARYAVKAFDPARKIPNATWEALETALQLTPSSYGLQPWKFFVIQDAALREKLRAASFNQRQVTECSHFVVFTHTPEVLESDVDHFLDSLSEARKIPREKLSGYRKVILGDLEGPRRPFLTEWTRHQCYIALGNFMTSCALVGVDTCPMEGLVPTRFDEILGIETSRFRTVVACAAGYRSPDDKTASMAKVRYPKNELFDRR